MMTVEDFKILAAGFFDEDLGYWESNGRDMLLTFINLARQTAVNQNDFFAMQRRLLTTVTSDGAKFKTDFYLPTLVTNEITLETSVSNVVCRVKSITDIFTFTQDEATVTLTGSLPYRLQSEADRIRDRGSYSFQAFYPEGEYLRVQGFSVPVDVAVRAYIYPTPLTSADNDTEDFFLEVGQNWMLQKVLGLMNMKVREDQRLNLAKRYEDQAWREFVNADASMGDSATDFTDLL